MRGRISNIPYMRHLARHIGRELVLELLPALRCERAERLGRRYTGGRSSCCPRSTAPSTLVAVAVGVLRLCGLVGVVVVVAAAAALVLVAVLAAWLGLGLGLGRG